MRCTCRKRRHWNAIQTFDYAFVADVDMVFVRPVGVEVRPTTLASMALPRAVAPRAYVNAY